jgi:hypothetical protein
MEDEMTNDNPALGRTPVPVAWTTEEILAHIAVDAGKNDARVGVIVGRASDLDEPVALYRELPPPQPHSVGRAKVPEGQIPLNDDLKHRLLDVFNEGIEARKTGTRSPYHGHSLEHCLHASGWVQQDLRMALDVAEKCARDQSTPSPSQDMVRTDRDDGITFGIAMSVAFLIRDRDEPSIAREWWDATGLTIEQCKRVGLDEYDLAPIRAALAATATEGSEP